MNRVADGADGALFGVTVIWQAVDHGVAAIFAEFDGGSVDHPQSVIANSGRAVYWVENKKRPPKKPF
jgi:hypothetical protein